MLDKFLNIFKKNVVECGHTLSPNEINERRKRAFTLAETMVVIAMLGVVAVVSLPSIFTKYQATVKKTKIKKAMATFDRVIRQAQAENRLQNSTKISTYLKGPDNTCGNIKKYLRAVESDNDEPCLFRTKDGLWWSLAPVGTYYYYVAESKDKLNVASGTLLQAGANMNNRDVFVFVVATDDKGRLRINDLAYAKNNCSGSSQCPMMNCTTKLFDYVNNENKYTWTVVSDKNLNVKCGTNKVSCADIINQDKYGFDYGDSFQGGYYAIYDENGDFVGVYYRTKGSQDAGTLEGKLNSVVSYDTDASGNSVRISRGSCNSSYGCGFNTRIFVENKSSNSSYNLVGTGCDLDGKNCTEYNLVNKYGTALSSAKLSNCSDFGASCTCTGSSCGYYKP